VPTVRLARIEALVFRYPVAVPVRTSFGTMYSRPALFVRAEDRDGAVGWGEVWCNFPSVGAEHRARILQEIIAPLVVGREARTPAAIFAGLEAGLAVLALQSGEPGPIRQAIAGLDIAIWDLLARLAGQPLWRFLGGASPDVAAYASGINPDDAAETAARALAAGHRAFKLKVGFGIEADCASLAAVRAVVGAEAPLAVDANQAWSISEACAAAARLEPFEPAWLEEPLRADRPWSEWRELARATRIPLAAGENIAGEGAFSEAIAAEILGVVQPDLAKWGGFTGCLPVARAVVASRATFHPHYLGAGIGLAASAHLLAAAGGGGALEMDVNDNPLRDALLPGPLRVREGHVRLTDAPGLGVEPDLERLRAHRVETTSFRV